MNSVSKECLNEVQPPVVQKVDNVIHRINHYPLDSAIGFAMTYPLVSDLSGGSRYPSFEQLGPGFNGTQANSTSPDSRISSHA